MAQQVTNATEAQQVMREILDPRIYRTFEEMAVTWGMFPDGGAEFISDVGAQWVNDLEPNPGIRGMSATQTTFHRGSTSKRQRNKVTYAQLAITRAFDGNILFTDVKSLVRGWAPMIKDDTKTFVKHLNLLWHGDGTGTLATVAAVDPNATNTAIVTMTQPYGTTSLLRRGTYNITSNDGNYTKRTFTISAVATSILYMILKTGSDIASFSADEAATVADTTTATTVVAGDIVVVQDMGGIAPHGLAYHFNNSVRTYQNLNTGTYPQLIPVLVDAGNGPVSVRLMDALEFDLSFRSGSEEVLDGMFWLCSWTQIAGIKKLGYNTDVKVVKRAGMGDKELDLGYTTVRHNGRTIMVDGDADPTRMMLMNRPTWQKYMAKPPSVVDDAGGVLNKRYASTGEVMWSYTININTLCELANKEIWRNGALVNLLWQGLPAKRDVITF